MDALHEIWPQGEPRPTLHGRVWTSDGRIWTVTAVYINEQLEVCAYDLTCKTETREEVSKEKMAAAVKAKKAKCLGPDADIWRSLT